MRNIFFFFSSTGEIPCSALYFSDTFLCCCFKGTRNCNKKNFFRLLSLFFLYFNGFSYENVEIYIIIVGSMYVHIDSFLGISPKKQNSKTQNQNNINKTNVALKSEERKLNWNVYV